MITRDELVKLADRRVAEALVFASAGQFAGAYYLLGYAIEHAIKAILADKILARTMPDRKFVESFYEHDLAKLASHAGLSDPARDRSRADPHFAANWNVVRTWKVDARYRDVGFEDYAGLERAVLDPHQGVLPWIRIYW